MSNFFKNVMMFLGSSNGLFIIWSIFCTIYLAKKYNNHVYFLCLLVPIIPIIFFLKEKKTKTAWVVFLLVIIFHVLFTYYLEPNIANKQLLKVEFSIDNKDYVITREEEIDLITNIKWDIYKVELFHNLGIKTKLINAEIIGDLRYYVDKTYVIIHDYPLNNIVTILKASNKRKVKPGKI